MNQRSLAHLALFAVNLIYGANYVIAKGLMPAIIGPSGFILLRVIGATALFWCIRLFRPERVHTSDFGRLVLCAVSGVALNQLMFFHGLMRTSPVHASLIMVATPILVLVMSGILIGERIVAGKVAGVIAGAVGASLLIMLRDPDDQTSSLMGDVFILINASAFGIYLVMVKPLMARYSAVTVMSWTFLIGTMLVLPFGAGELASVRWTALSNGQVAAMTFVVVMVTFVAYLLNTWALGVVHPSVVGSFIYLQPVFATAIALLGNDHVHVGLPQAVSAVLIFLGVHLVTRADRRERAID